jgi:integrase
MARTLALEPTYFTGRPKPWMLRVPPYLSDTGKVKRLFYRTKREAETAAEIVRTRAANYGHEGNILSPSRMTIAREAFLLLGDRPDVALLEALRDALTIEQKRNESVPWSILVDEFIALKQTRSDKHRRNLRYTRERFSSLDKRNVSDITPDDLAVILKPLLPSSRNLEIRHLNSIFVYAHKRGWILDNPVKKLDTIELDRREVEVFSAAQAESLFNYALDVPGLIPLFVFGFFAGIRPEGELQKLEWSNVHFGGVKPELEIPPGASKTRRRRFVDLSENAIKWLEVYQKLGGRMEGPLVPYTPAVLRKRRRDALQATGIKWIQQGMRHTFCSAWLARYHDVNRLLLMSGHDDPETLWRFYHRGMTEKEATKFWAIVPLNAEKIVAFHAIA